MAALEKTVAALVWRWRGLDRGPFQLGKWWHLSFPENPLNTVRAARKERVRLAR